MSKERLAELLALKWMEGEPWEHTGMICSAIHNAALLICLACGSNPSVLEELSKSPQDFQPPQVSGRRRKEPEQDESKPSSTDDWMRKQAGVTRG